MNAIMNEYLTDLEQHAEIDAALLADSIELDAAETGAYSVASLIRLHTTRGVIDVGIGPLKVAYSEDRGGRNLYGVVKTADSYGDALHLLTAAIRNGAPVVTIERGNGYEWTQEVWTAKAVS